MPEEHVHLEQLQTGNAMNLSLTDRLRFFQPRLLSTPSQLLQSDHADNVAVVYSSVGMFRTSPDIHSRSPVVTELSHSSKVFNSQVDVAL